MAHYGKINKKISVFGLLALISALMELGKILSIYAFFFVKSISRKISWKWSIHVFFRENYTLQHTYLHMWYKSVSRYTLKQSSQILFKNWYIDAVGLALHPIDWSTELCRISLADLKYFFPILRLSNCWINTANMRTKTIK